MLTDKVMVYTTNKLLEAELLKNYLADNGIASFSIDKRDSSYLFGDIEIYVNRDEVIRAKLLIEKFEN
jgi:hypothetical protein